MQVKKRLFALLLSLCMALSILPATVFAAEDPLPAPQNPRFEGTVAKWDPVEGAASYNVVLYRDNQPIAHLGGAATECDLAASLTVIGEYYFTVVGLREGESFGPQDTNPNGMAKSELFIIEGSKETDPYEPQIIDSVVLEVDEPAEGKPADFSIQSQESDPYDVGTIAWYKCAAIDDTNALDILSEGDTFEKGWYRLNLAVYMDFNYTATEDLVVSLGGTEPERLTVDIRKSLVDVEAWFAIDPPGETQKITSLTFEEIPIPEAGIDFGQAEDTIKKQVTLAHDEQVKFYSASYYEWRQNMYDDFDSWNTVSSRDEYDGSLVYGVHMILYAQTGWYFGDTPPEVTVNGEKAKVISLDPYRIEVFMQFGDIVVDYISIDSEIWPFDEQETRMEPDNFTVGYQLGAHAESLFTIKDARLQIKREKKGEWQDLTAEDTHFSAENRYTFYAKVEAADGVVFAKDARGRIRSTSYATVTVSEDGKSATLLHDDGLRVYRKAYVRTTKFENYPDMTDWETKDYKSIPLTIDKPEPGVEIKALALGVPDGKEVSYMDIGYSWNEVPYVGAKESLNNSSPETFEAGKTYMLYLSFRTNSDESSYYVPPDFDVEFFVDRDGNSLNYARKDSDIFSEFRKDLFFWFTVGEVGEPEAVEQIGITGPEDLVGLLGQEDDWFLSAEQLSNFKPSSDAFVIDDGSWYWDSNSGSGYLQLDLLVNSGSRFGLMPRLAFSYNDDSSRIVWDNSLIWLDGVFQKVQVKIYPSGADPHTHAYSEEWSSDANNHWHACDCGAKADTAAHAYGDWNITKEATKTEAGSKERTCTVCGYKQTETIPVIGHEHSYSEEWRSDENNHWHACDCGAKADTAAHAYGDWNITKEATKTEAGSKERTCTVCGYKQTETIPVIGHEHSYSEEWNSDENNHWHVCECGDKADTAAHTYGDWKVIKEATETEKGSRERICSVCGYMQAEVIPVTGTGQPVEPTEPTDPPTDPKQPTDPAKPEQPDKPDSDNPKTGDSSNMALWISLMLVSCGGVLGMLFYKRKNAAAGK